MSRRLWAPVTSRVLCQFGKGRGPCIFLKIFISKDGIEDSFHAGLIGKDPHKSSSAFYLPETKLNSVGCSDLRP